MESNGIIDNTDFQLKPAKGSNKKRKRVGRGTASGRGKTCGKGEKGQKSRKGRKRPYVGFEGGQMPIVRRLPKRGFNNSKFAKFIAEVKVGILNKYFNDGDDVNIKTLKEKKLIRNIFNQVKIIGGGELTKKLKIEVYNASKGAKDEIQKSGSSLTLLVEKINEN